MNDGVIKDIGHSKTQGHWTSCSRTSTATSSPTRTSARWRSSTRCRRPSHAGGPTKASFQVAGAHDPTPNAPASAGGQRPGAPAPPRPRRATAAGMRVPPQAARYGQATPLRPPERPKARSHGGFDQLLALDTPGFETYDSYFARGIGLNSKNASLKRLKIGSHVIASTVLGRLGNGARSRTSTSRSARRQGRAEDRPEAVPRRLEAARVDRDLPRQGRQRPLRRRQLLDRRDHAAAEAAAREARPERPAHQDLPRRPQRHQDRPDRPPRAGRARLPRGVRPQADRQLPEVRPQRDDHERERVRALLRQRRRHLGDQRDPDQRSTRAPAAWPSRPSSGS